MTRAAAKFAAIPTEFPQPRRVLLPESIADSIAEAIAARLLAPGDRIVETALSEKLGVSRVPIREALKVLHAQGILSGGGHRGYRVASFSAETVEKVLELRLMLESILLRDAVRNWRAGTDDPAELDLPIARMQMSARARDGGASLRADLEFHRAIARAARNEVAETLWNAIARHVLIIFSHERYRDSDLHAVARQHQAFRNEIFGWVEAEAEPARIKTALEDHLLLVARGKQKSAG
jgi:DNA-binding GntR family transcriptional regulator